MRYLFIIFSLLFIGLDTNVCAQTPLTSTAWSAYVDASPHGNFGNIPTGVGVMFSQWRRYNNATYVNASDGYNSQNLSGNPAGILCSYIKTNASTSLNITGLSFIVRRSATGPTYFTAYLHSPSTGVMNTIGTGYLNNTNDQTITFQTNYCIPANDSVELRLVLDRASNAGGTFRIINGTSISGRTNPLCSTPNLLITPPLVVCMGENASIQLSSVPGTTVVYNVNNQNVLGRLILDTVITNSTGNATITINNITGDSTIRIISAYTNPCCAINIMRDIILRPQPIVIPLFTQHGPYCRGTLATLSTTSDNGITGTWSPTFNNTATTTYTFTPTAGQCAVSGQTMTIQINPTASGTETAAICYGESYTFNGTGYTTSNNTATDTLAGFNGCDSIVTLNLTVLDSPRVLLVHLDACEQLVYNNQVYTQSTTLFDTLHSIWGCDSIYRQTRIYIHDKAIEVQVDTVACGEFWLNGVRHTTSTIERDTLYNIMGCDSLYRQLNIAIHQFKMRYTLEPEEPYAMESFTIRLGNEFPGGFEGLSWSPAHLFSTLTGEQQYLFMAQEQGIRVFGRSTEGCEDSLIIPVKLKSYGKDVGIPNAFTPNGDGLNDVFFPKLRLERRYNISEFRVYNRYGQLVHSTL